MDKRYLKGICLAIMSAVSFGIMPIFASMAYKLGSNAITVVFIRHLLSAILLLAIILKKGMDIRIDKDMFCSLLVCGVIGSAATALTLFMSYEFISVGLATILHFIYPIVVTGISVLMFKEKLDKNKLLSLGLSVAGVYILVGFSNIKVHLVGILLAISSGIFYSVYILMMGKSRLVEVEAKVLIFWISTISAFTTIIYGWVTDNLRFVYTLEFGLNIAGLIVVSTLGLVFIACAVKIIGPTKASILSTFEPITSILLGSILFGEKITLSIVVGSALIILSIRGIVKEEEKSLE